MSIDINLDKIIDDTITFHYDPIDMVEIEKCMQEAIRQALIPFQWIEIKEGCEMPEPIDDGSCSANVLAIVDGRLRIMAYCYIHAGEDSGWAWCDCGTDIYGDPEFDDYYNITHWMYLPNIPPSTINK